MAHAKYSPLETSGPIGPGAADAVVRVVTVVVVKAPVPEAFDLAVQVPVNAGACAICTVERSTKILSEFEPPPPAQFIAPKVSVEVEGRSGPPFKLSRYEKLPTTEVSGAVTAPLGGASIVAVIVCPAHAAVFARVTSFNTLAVGAGLEKAVPLPNGKLRLVVPATGKLIRNGPEM